MSDSVQVRMGRMPAQLVGGWELGLLVLMAILFAGGALINPAFFGSGDAFHAILRDTARYAVMAVGMTFVIVNKDLDLSVGSTNGLIGVAFSILFAPQFHRLGPGPGAPSFCLALGTFIGLHQRRAGHHPARAVLHRHPHHAADRARHHPRPHRRQIDRLCGQGARAIPGSSTWARPTPSASTTRSRSRWSIVAIGAVVLAKTRWGYETFATGGNEQAAAYAGIPTRWVRIRAYLLSSLCATLAGLMAITQDKGVTAQAGLSAELIVIAAVIIGGASILGGRGRVIGACLGATLTVVIDKVLREGWPTTPHHPDRRRRTSTVNAIAPAAGRRGAGPARRAAAARGAGRALCHAPAADRAVLGLAAQASRRRRSSRPAASPSKACRPRARWRATRR